ncbi:OsmC family protein [Nocardioides bruguierae]|uniref:OsmC family protein n=1 Tax=Nocardioides bruguierae TaxID=2945102 RepID=A0A9X2D4L1_9ACTN|nr:OsmC family protein [Nocardioides bruguierae]MCM0619066.1 OsmC family protein [Nocardioides bruguierae]
MAPDLTAADAVVHEPTHRWVDLEQTDPDHYRATNRRGGELRVGAGDDADFTPVELLLAALAGCGAIDLALITGKRAPATSLRARAEGHKIRDEQGNRMSDLQVTFDVAFPDGEAGDAARAVLERTVRMIEDRLCTVGRTVTVGDHVRYRTTGE